MRLLYLDGTSHLDTDSPEFEYWVVYDMANFNDNDNGWPIIEQANKPVGEALTTHAYSTLGIKQWSGQVRDPAGGGWSTSVSGMLDVIDCPPDRGRATITPIRRQNWEHGAEMEVTAPRHAAAARTMIVALGDGSTRTFTVQPGTGTFTARLEHTYPEIGRYVRSEQDWEVHNEWYEWTWGTLVYLEDDPTVTPGIGTAGVDFYVQWIC